MTAIRTVAGMIVFAILYGFTSGAGCHELPRL